MQRESPNCFCQSHANAYQRAFANTQRYFLTHPNSIADANIDGHTHAYRDIDIDPYSDADHHRYTYNHTHAHVRLP